MLAYERDVLGILTDLSKSRRDADWANNADVRLDPEGIANVSNWDHLIIIVSLIYIHQTYLALAKQDRSALTWELDRKCSDLQVSSLPDEIVLLKFVLLMRNGEIIQRLAVCLAM
jgi:hypothetical protein